MGFRNCRSDVQQYINYLNFITNLIQPQNAGTPSFSIGITEILNTNPLIEPTTDDIGYVYQRSPGKLSSVTIPTFETLTQFGVATVSAKNIG
ncbi:hypothetical protein Peur_057275 [Populus x canadensis]